MTDYKNIIAEINQISNTTSSPDLIMPPFSLIDSDDKIINVAVIGQFKSGKSSLTRPDFCLQFL
jgi:polynucleotide 5'-kinase involved in rRNA processing